MPLYEPSKRRLTWPNGNVALLGTADEPDSLRGVQANYSWADEVAAWRQTPDAAGMTSWDNLRVATRLGTNPQILATTTPKRVKLLYDLLGEADRTGKIWVSRGSTMDNAGNLSSSYIDAITGVYEGTRLARQELYGEMLDAVEGALWTDELIENNRQNGMPSSVPLRVIGVDPSVAENPRDECGIVVVASTGERDLYKRQSWVIEDASVLGSPTVWAQRVVAMARKWGCPVVAEVNQGGALVRNAIQTIDPTIQVLEVHSKYGKALRAEPITLAYEQGRVHHIGFLAELESQMTSWIPGEGKSPDRVDALVHALTALLIKPPAGFLGGNITARSVAGKRITLGRGGRTGGRLFGSR
jgi:phage terminase large subunit-like protein